jgi:DNA polymerase-3 subunit epsilon
MAKISTMLMASCSLFHGIAAKPVPNRRISAFATAAAKAFERRKRIEPLCGSVCVIKRQISHRLGLMRELVLDTETTGLDPKDGHRVIELACVELINYIPTGTHWHWYFNPERDVPKAATDVHGLTAAFLADKPLFGAAAEEIVAVLGDARLIIHNAAFDIGFLNHEFGRLGHAPLSMERVTDTLALARRKHPGSPNNLDALCRRYGIDNSTRVKHGALLDCELLADVYLGLTGGGQAGLDLALQSANAKTESQIVVQVRDKPLPPRLCAEEETAHAAFIASLGPNALWLRFGQALAGT